MKRRFRIVPRARADFLDAFEYLESQQRGLAKRLSTLIRIALFEIRDHPNRFPKLRGRYRRYRVSPFKYAIVYFVDADATIVVEAFFHLMRNPKRLDDRLG
jgi:plasmid stabilization system protein ParE